MPSLRLDPDLGNVVVARIFVGECVDGRVTEPDLVLLMVSELVTNVFKHTEAEVRVSVRFGPPVRVEVHDGVAATDAFRELVRTPPPQQLTDESGRGLGIVHALAQRVGLDDDPGGGKVVWFEV